MGGRIRSQQILAVSKMDTPLPIRKMQSIVPLSRLLEREGVNHGV